MKIAEGCGRDTVADYIACLRLARGIGMDADYQLLLARDLHFIETEAHETLQGQLIEVRKMLTGLIKPKPV